MFKLKILKYFILTFFVTQIFILHSALADDKFIIRPEVDIFIIPQTGHFVLGEDFEIPLFLNTKGNNVSKIELNIKYDSTKLEVLSFSKGKSIMEEWNTSPLYDNESGIISFTGVASEGITTESGLLTSIIFKAKEPGIAKVYPIEDSKVSVLNELVSSATININVGIYNILSDYDSGTEYTFEVNKKDLTKLSVTDKGSKFVDLLASLLYQHRYIIFVLIGLGAVFIAFKEHRL